MDILTTFIRPGEELRGQRLALSTIDQIAPRDYNVLHLFFRLDPSESKYCIFQSLEKAMLETASEIPEILCTVRKCQNPRNELELVYDGKGGAQLSMKDYTCAISKDRWKHGTFNDLVEQHFPLSKLEAELLLGAIQSLEDDCQVPGLLLQANFIEGGLILSTSLHHTICDGSGMNSFHQTLARHLTAISISGKSSNMSKIVDGNKASLHKRTDVVKPIFGGQLGDFPNWMLANTTNVIPELTTPLPSVKYSIYTISGDKTFMLRERINEMSNSRFSTLQAVAAFIWLHVVRARRVDTNIYPEAKLSITVDARSFMTDPVVPSTYWGNFCEPNAVAYCATSCFSEGAANRGDLKFDKMDQSSEKLRGFDWSVTLPHLANLVKQAIVEVDSIAVQGLVGLIDNMPTVTDLTWNVDRWPGPDMLIVPTNRFMWNSMQYGMLGYSHASRITIGTTASADGRCILLPPPRDDKNGIEVALQYDTATLERLKADRAFSEFFSWRN